MNQVKEEGKDLLVCNSTVLSEEEEEFDHRRDVDDDPVTKKPAPWLVQTLSRCFSAVPSEEATSKARDRGSFHASNTTIHSLVGISLIVLGSFCFSCMFLFVKFMQGVANSFTMAFYRALVEIPIALLVCQYAKENPLGSRLIRPWLLVRGGMGAAAVLCFFYAIQGLPLPDAVTLQFTTPPFAAAFAVCIVGEAWSVMDRLGAVVCLLGVMLIAHPSWLFESTTTTNDSVDKNGKQEQQQQEKDMGAIVVALLGAAFAGIAYTSVRRIGHEASANVMVLYYSCLSLPVTLIGSYGLLGEWNVWGGSGTFTRLDWCWMLFTGIFAYTGQYLTNLGLQNESAAKGTLATCTQIVFTYIFELLFLHEAMNSLSICGTMLIIGFMVLVAIHKMKATAETVIRHEMVASGPEGLELV